MIALRVSEGLLRELDAWCELHGFTRTDGIKACIVGRLAREMPALSEEEVGRIMGEIRDRVEGGGDGRD